MKLTFLGATQTVTGSKYLLEHGGKKILVDCGLFQGHKEVRQRNWEKLPIDPRNIDAIVLTHAHIDHSGYIPLLVKNGFRGKIFCSKATFDFYKKKMREWPINTAIAGITQLCHFTMRKKRKNH